MTLTLKIANQSFCVTLIVVLLLSYSHGIKKKVVQYSFWLPNFKTNNSSSSNNNNKNLFKYLQQRCHTLGSLFVFNVSVCFHVHITENPRWGAVDAEIEVQYDETTELKGPPFKAWSRSVYCYACYAYCQGFLPCYFLPFGPFTCIFSKTSPKFFLC